MSDFRSFAGRDAPLFIAEVGGNHEGDFAYAERLVQGALGTRAHAVKLQAYRADHLVSARTDPVRHAHFERFELHEDEYLALAASCGRRFMCSVWDERLLRLLDPHLAVHKLGSGDLTHRSMLRALVETGKPLIVSTAMARLTEIDALVAFVDELDPGLRKSGRLCLMHCVAMYGDPRPEHASLAGIRVLQQRYPDIPIGYSDHTRGTRACELAAALGASVIEKHFTDDPDREFRDHHISATRSGFDAMMARVDDVRVLLGGHEKAPVAAVETEERIREFRRGLYTRHALPAGRRLEAADLAGLRPAEGISAWDAESVLGRRLRTALPAGAPLRWEDVDA